MEKNSEMLLGRHETTSASKQVSGGLEEGQGQCLETLQGEKRVVCLPILYPNSWTKWGSMDGAKPWSWGA